MPENTDTEEIVIIEANIDDQIPYITAYAMKRIMNEGALDAWITPIVMKKGRLAIQLSVMVQAEQVNYFADIIFQETSSIGIRYFPVKRIKTTRVFSEEQINELRVDVKHACYNDKVYNVMPEYEHCKRVAIESNQPLKKVQDTALIAARQSV